MQGSCSTTSFLLLFRGKLMDTIFFPTCWLNNSPGFYAKTKDSRKDAQKNLWTLTMPRK